MKFNPFAVSITFHRQHGQNQVQEDKGIKDVGQKIVDLCRSIKLMTYPFWPENKLVAYWPKCA